MSQTRLKKERKTQHNILYVQTQEVFSMEGANNYGACGILLEMVLSSSFIILTSNFVNC